jgi:CRP-like cAMP-binding protein
LNRTHSVETNLEDLSSLSAFSWLAPPELRSLAEALEVIDIKRPLVILEGGSFSNAVHILLKGIARLTCQDAHGARIAIALLPPAPIPPAPPLLNGRFGFRWEAHADCRVGNIDLRNFNHIMADRLALALKRFHDNDLKLWHRIVLRNSNAFKLGLREKVAITMLDLASDFGIKESRGVLLKEYFSHQDIAGLVGASRPRVTEHLAQLERENLVIRQGRKFIVHADRIRSEINARPQNKSNVSMSEKH